MRRWGLGSQRGCLFVEDCSAGVIGAWTSPQEVAALLAALDNRGLRERGLLSELTKVGVKLAILCSCKHARVQANLDLKWSAMLMLPHVQLPHHCKCNTASSEGP